VIGGHALGNLKHGLGQRVVTVRLVRGEVDVDVADADVHPAGDADHVAWLLARLEVDLTTNVDTLQGVVALVDVGGD
jgi:hypothetical protein